MNRHPEDEEDDEFGEALCLVYGCLLDPAIRRHHDSEGNNEPQDCLAEKPGNGFTVGRVSPAEEGLWDAGAALWRLQ